MPTDHFHTFRVLHNLKQRQPQHRWWWQVWVPLWGSCWWWWWWSWWSLLSLLWWWGGETRTTHGSSRQRVLRSWMLCTVVGGPCSPQPCSFSVPVFWLSWTKLWHKAWNRNQSLRLWIIQHDEPHSSIERHPKCGSLKEKSTIIPLQMKPSAVLLNFH